MTSRLKEAKVIFECFVEISSPSDTEEARIRSVYPKDYKWDDDTKKQLPKFAFPTRSSNESEEHFTFVLTDLDGKYRFGFCRYPPKGDTCLCFLSDLSWYKVFYRSLDKISEMRLNHQHEVVEPFLAGLRAHAIPNLGVDTVLSIVPKGVDTGQVYTFPLPNPKRLPEIPTDDNLTQFYTNLHYNVILHLFANMMFERRIIITSNSLSLLSSTVHGAVKLLYPLNWQHIFIPITPPHLLDYCAAPMPFLMGIHSSYMDLVRRMPIEDVVVLDVDESALESPHVDDLETFPSEVINSLRHILKKQSSAYGDTVARSFLRAQVTMVGGYRSAFRQGEKEIVFDEEQFLKSRPNSEVFLQSMLHSQHFRQFINSKIEKLKSKNQERDRFDDEVMMYEEEVSGTEHLKAGWDKFVSQTVVRGKKWGDKLKEGSEKFQGKVNKQAKIADKSLKDMMKKLGDQKYSNYQTTHVNILQDSDLPGRTYSLPLHKSASESVIHQTLMTPPPILHPSQSVKLSPRKPPSVIPYHRHIEGKQKLAEILRIQSTNTDSTVGTLVTFTPPGTPRSVSNAENFESASLDSRESTEVTISYTELVPSEVAVGNLIELNAVMDVSVTLCTDSSSDSDSILSTTSSSGLSTNNGKSDRPKHQWETFDDADSQDQHYIQAGSLSNRPPIPPPRSALLEVSENSDSYASLRNKSNTPVDLPVDSPSPVITNPFAEFETESDVVLGSELIFNTQNENKDNDVRQPSPFESLHLDHPDRPTSPFADFSSSIAQALLDKLDPKDDPQGTHALVNASHDLFKSNEEMDDLILVNEAAEPGVDVSKSPPDLLPAVTTGIATQNIKTEIPRSAAQIDLKSNSSPPSNILHISNSSPSVTSTDIPLNHTHTLTGVTHAPVYFQGCQNSFSESRERKPSGPRSPNFPQLVPLTFNSRGFPSKKPPPRPQPYSGDQVAQFRKQFQKGPSTKYDPLADTCLQRLPSLGSFNPFKDILGEGGMEGYVSGQGSSRGTPLV